MDIILVLVFFASGIILGRINRTGYYVKSFVNKFMMWAVYVLLFLLGISVGNNPQIMDNFHTLGWQALLLAVGSVFGSLFLGWLLALIYQKIDEYEK